MPDKPKMSDIRTFFGFQDEELIRSLPHFHELEKSIQGTLASSIRDIAHAPWSITDLTVISTPSDLTVESLLKSLKLYFPSCASISL